MPSIADSKRFVQDALNAGPDHDAILASLQNEIDKHNRLKSDTKDDGLRSRRTDKHRSDLRFRFKDGDPRPRRRKRRRTRSPSPVRESSQSVHPFPREPTSPTAEPADDAFLSSLLDALADDEAAAYWESVYSQPLHAFARPNVETKEGELEQMSDEQYAAWVKQKMWEKQHPELILERDKTARKRKEEASHKQRRKEEFIRRREKEAWDRASRQKTNNDDEDAHEYAVPDANTASRSGSRESTEDWRQAWTDYLRRWEKLKASSDRIENPSSILPWPTLPSKPPTRPHIEQFLRNMPLQDGSTRQAVLKAERVRWHPDKIQQRFQGQVDQGTMKVVTGIFQIVDAIWNEMQQT